MLYSQEYSTYLKSIPALGLRPNVCASNKFQTVEKITYDTAIQRQSVYAAR